MTCTNYTHINKMGARPERNICSIRAYDNDIIEAECPVRGDRTRCPLKRRAGGSDDLSLELSGITGSRTLLLGS